MVNLQIDALYFWYKKILTHVIWFAFFVKLSTRHLFDMFWNCKDNGNENDQDDRRSNHSKEGQDKGIGRGGGLSPSVLFCMLCICRITLLSGRSVQCVPNHHFSVQCILIAIILYSVFQSTTSIFLHVHMLLHWSEFLIPRNVCKKHQCLYLFCFFHRIDWKRFCFFSSASTIFFLIQHYNKHNGLFFLPSSAVTGIACESN